MNSKDVTRFDMMATEESNLFADGIIAVTSSILVLLISYAIPQLGFDWFFAYVIAVTLATVTYHTISDRFSISVLLFIFIIPLMLLF